MVNYQIRYQVIYRKVEQFGPYRSSDLLYTHTVTTLTDGYTTSLANVVVCSRTKHFRSQEWGWSRTTCERERAKDTGSERGRYETDDALMFCLAPSFGRLTLRPLRARWSRALTVSTGPLRKSWRRPGSSLLCALGEPVKLRPLL